MEAEPRESDRRQTAPKRWPALSVRGLMLLVLVAGGLLGWYLRVVREQRGVVEAIRQAGGSVGYDWQVAASANLSDLVKSTSGPPSSCGGRVVWPEWLVRLVGVDTFGRVNKVWFTGGRSTISAPLLAQVGKLHALELLGIQNRTLETAGLAHLANLSRLRVLDLSVKAEGDSTDLTWLRSMTRLELLNLGNLAVRDDDLACLRPLANLRALVIRSPRITDKGLEHLAGLTRLESLSFVHDNIRGAGLKHLARMLSLETLALIRSQLETLEYLPALPLQNLVVPFAPLDDRGLEHFPPIPSLSLVYLDGTKITDASLDRLHSGPNLELHVSGTGVTPAGITAFQALQPRRSVRSGPIQASPYFLVR